MFSVNFAGQQFKSVANFVVLAVHVSLTPRVDWLRGENGSTAYSVVVYSGRSRLYP